MVGPPFSRGLRSVARTIAKVRSEIAPLARFSNGPMVSAAEKRIGKDGKHYPREGGAVRTEIRRVLEEDSGASLRSVAARTGASPETVRGVKRSIAMTHDEVQHSIGRYPASAYRSAIRASGWSEDSACSSTQDGRDFAEWFDQHRLDDDVLLAMAQAVPISRLYDVIDETRRRKDFWEAFAKELQNRVFRAGATGS